MAWPNDGTPNNPWVAARREKSGPVFYAPDPDALKAARKSAHMSQAALAKGAECSQSMIGHLETGHRGRVTEFLASSIAATLGRDLGDVFVPIEPEMVDA